MVSLLMGWEHGARIGQDDLLWKPPGAKGVAYHQDGGYISDQFVPNVNNSVTVWIALDDATTETGVVEYAKGSHDWKKDSSMHSTGDSDFHGFTDHLTPLRAAA